MSKKPNKHRARKRFGQNFLQDQTVIQRIIRAIAPSKTDNLVEIGPGMGALTESLLAEAGKLEVIELDRDLPPILRAKLFKYEKTLNIHQADALDFDYSQLVANSEKLRIVGNLPYNISTPLIFHLLSQAQHIKDMHFMLQKEVVDRMAAQTAENNYGRLSIMTQYHCQVSFLFQVSPTAFKPEPKVQSAIVRLIPYIEKPFNANNPEQFFQLVKMAFGMRRKTLKNNLKTLISSMELEKLEINPELRPEKLSLEKFVHISNYLNPK